MEIDDVDACQLLSMLAMDRCTRAIPVETCVMGAKPDDFHYGV